MLDHMVGLHSRLAGSNIPGSPSIKGKGMDFSLALQGEKAGEVPLGVKETTWQFSFNQEHNNEPYHHPVQSKF